MLVIDGSAVMRATLDGAFAARRDIVVVGHAASVAHAVLLMKEIAADVILLDLGLAAVDGFGALSSLTARAGGAPVLVVSAACIPGATATALAMGMGAADVFAKPPGLAFAGTFSEALVERVRRLGRGSMATRTRCFARTPPRPLAVVGVAASTGGVDALGQFVNALPPGFAAPILVTQHMPESFIPFFVGHLAKTTGRPTRTAETGMQPLPGEILVAPSHAHLTLVRVDAAVRVRLDRAPAPSGCRPSADPMFSSLARTFGAGAAAVVLSGMGRDGVDGVAELAATGASIFVQDAATSVVWGMPGAVARRGLARAVLPPLEIASALVRDCPEYPVAQFSGARVESGAMQLVA